jgi:hypothetical protein
MMISLSKNTRFSIPCFPACLLQLLACSMIINCVNDTPLINIAACDSSEYDALLPSLKPSILLLAPVLSDRHWKLRRFG